MNRIIAEALEAPAENGDQQIGQAMFPIPDVTDKASARTEAALNALIASRILEGRTGGGRSGTCIISEQLETAQGERLEPDE